MLLLTCEGQTHEVSVPEWRARRRGAPVEDQRRMDDLVRRGSLADEDGQPLELHVENRVRERLLDLHPDSASVATFGEQLRRHRNEGGTRFLIPGLWPWGSFPQLGGNPKAGKTTLMAELCAALVQPGRRLFGAFDPATLTDEERGLGVILINTEMDAAPVLDALVEAGLGEDDRLSVIHLREEGGARAFDLTDADLYRSWVDRLIWCKKCDGTDEFPPAVVIVDNMTAVLQDLGRPLEDYGELHGRFVQLMAEVGCANGLTVVHNTLAGGHAMGGTTAQNRPDGLWNYWSDNPDVPTSKRWFNVVPRLGGVAVPTTQVLFEEGRLRLADAPAPVVEGGTEEGPDYGAQVVERLTEAGAAGLLRKEVTGTGREGQLRRAALNALIEAGEVVERDEPSGGRGRPRRCWLSSVLVSTGDQSPGVSNVS